VGGTYVGLPEASGSPFAMIPERYHPFRSKAVFIGQNNESSGVGSYILIGKGMSRGHLFDVNTTPGHHFELSLCLETQPSPQH
jgi:hypothetical protein